MGHGKHSPNEMGHSPNEMSREFKYMPAVEDMTGQRASSIINAGARSRMGGQPQMGHSPNEMKGSPNHQETDPKDGEKKPTTLQSVRNFVDPGYKSIANQNSSRQMFDADGDGDTMFNDSNKDGTMLSRGFKTAREYMKRNFPIEGRTTSLTRPYREFSEGIDTSGDWNDKFKMETGRTKKPIGKMN